MIKKILLGSAAIFLMGAQAQAANIVEPAVYDWTGGADDEADLAFHTVRAGLSWHFTGL